MGTSRETASPVASLFTIESLAITAPLIGIAAPAAHYIHLLSEYSRKIVDAPRTLDSHRKDILSVEQVLASLQTISDAQWKLLGEIVTNHLKATATACGESCNRFRTDLSRWTRHSEDGKLSLRDRTVGSHLKSTTEQLQHCKITLTRLSPQLTL
ncbi:hypothetical protein P885DRAFT_45041 [Corynascus similis CBS 632.67]